MVTGLVGLFVVLSLSVLVLAVALAKRTLRLERLLVLERHSSDVAWQEKAAIKEAVAIEIAAMVVALREIHGDAEVIASAKQHIIDQSRMFAETVERAARDLDQTVSGMVCMMRECVTQAEDHFRQAEAARAALRRSEALRLQSQR